MTIEDFNMLDISSKKELLRQCCGSAVWVEDMLKCGMSKRIEDLIIQAKKIWDGLSDIDWKEGFSHHPKIGDIEALRNKFSADRFASGEQGKLAHASDTTLQLLAEK